MLVLVLVLVAVTVTIDITNSSTSATTGIVSMTVDVVNTFCVSVLVEVTSSVVVVKIVDLDISGIVLELLGDSLTAKVEVTVRAVPVVLIARKSNRSAQRPILPSGQSQESFGQADHVSTTMSGSFAEGSTTGIGETRLSRSSSEEETATLLSLGDLITFWNSS